MPVYETPKRPGWKGIFMIKQVDVIDSIRLEVGENSDLNGNQSWSIYDPGSVASSWQPFLNKGRARILLIFWMLAGIGSLSCALFENWLHENPAPPHLPNRFEIDPFWVITWKRTSHL